MLTAPHETLVRPTPACSRRPIVVMGSPRSGTTLLTTMMHAHPRIAMPPETRWVQGVYRRRDEFGDLNDPANRRKVAAFIMRKGTRFRELKIDPGRTTRRIVSAAPTLGSVTAAVFEEFAASRNKERWGDKRPSYTMWVDRLLAMWPEMQVIYMVRDPRACVASILRSPWFSGGFDEAVTAWARGEIEMRKFARRAVPGQYYKLRYEDLVADPGTELKQLCAFLGEHFDDAMLRHQDAAEDIVPNWETYHDRTRQDIDPSRVHGWTRDLTAEQIGLIELVCALPMHRHGYQRSRLGRRPPLGMISDYERTFRRLSKEYRDNQRQDARKRERENRPLAMVSQS